jgi:hypothetical protein
MQKQISNYGINEYIKPFLLSNVKQKQLCGRAIPKGSIQV